MKEPYKSKQWLEEKYEKYGNTLSVAENTGFNRKTIKKYADMHGIHNPGYRSKMKKYGLNESYFCTIDTEEKAYWLGFLVADGCLYHKKTSYDIQINLKISDISHLNKMADAMSSEKRPEVKNQGEKEIAFFRISSKRMFKDLERLGLSQNKTGNERMPSIDDSLKRHFIRGYFDGDGCISQYGSEDPYTFNIVCSNESFLKEIAEDIKKNTSEELVPYKVKNNAYILTSVAKRKNYFIYKYLYDDTNIAMDRKKEKAEHFLKSYAKIVNHI